jgi:hypothetical protein
MEHQKEKTRTKPSTSSLVTAADRCRAVLSIWTEKRTPSEVCKELSIQWTILHHWQKRAMEGMLQALEPRVNLETAPALSPKLLHLLASREKELVENGPTERLSRRLARRLASVTGRPQKQEPATENTKHPAKEA